MIVSLALDRHQWPAQSSTPLLTAKGSRGEQMLPAIPKARHSKPADQPTLEPTPECPSQAEAIPVGCCTDGLPMRFLREASLGPQDPPLCGPAGLSRLASLLGKVPHWLAPGLRGGVLLRRGPLSSGGRSQEERERGLPSGGSPHPPRSCGAGLPVLLPQPSSLHSQEAMSLAHCSCAADLGSRHDLGHLAAMACCAQLVLSCAVRQAPVDRQLSGVKPA